MNTFATLAQNPLWYLARGSGLVAFVLMTVSVVLGIVIAGRGPAVVPRFAAQGVHRVVGLSTLGAVILHVVCIVADAYVPVGWTAVLVPFVSGYRPLGVGLGALAFDVLLAVAGTSLVRHRLGNRGWRAVHLLSYVGWPLVLLHQLLTGTDAPYEVGLVVTFACGATVVAALAARLTVIARHRRFRRGVLLGARP